MRPSDGRRGAALFIVLALSALLASLVGATMRTGVSGTRAAAVFADGARADELGRAAGDVVSYRLATGAVDALRGGRLLIRFAGVEVVINYLSESARIDANAAPLPLISALLAAAGADPSLVGEVIERIRLLRLQTGGGQPGEFADASAQTPVASTASTTRASGPPAIQNALDVVRAWGLPADVGRRVLPALTVASGSKQVDPILASHLILLALFGGDDARASDYEERRQQGFIDAGSARALLPIPAQAFVGFTDVQAVRAVARVTIARRFERSYEMILVPGQGSGIRPTVVSWRKFQ